MIGGFKTPPNLDVLIYSVIYSVCERERVFHDVIVFQGIPKDTIIKVRLENNDLFCSKKLLSYINNDWCNIDACSTVTDAFQKYIFEKWSKQHRDWQFWNRFEFGSFYLWFRITYRDECYLSLIEGDTKMQWYAVRLKDNNLFCSEKSPNHIGNGYICIHYRIL